SSPAPKRSCSARRSPPRARWCSPRRARGSCRNGRAVSIALGEAQLAEDQEPEFRQDVIHMTRDGAITLADVREPMLEIVCQPCGRRGSYNVERLIAALGGDVKLPDLLATLVNCEKVRSVSTHDRCKARYARYYGP